MTAPATIGAGMPNPVPTPTNANPTVPAVVQELPVAILTNEQITMEVTKKKSGDNTFSP